MVKLWKAASTFMVKPWKAASTFMVKPWKAASTFMVKPWCQTIMANSCCWSTYINTMITEKGAILAQITKATQGQKPWDVSHTEIWLNSILKKEMCMKLCDMSSSGFVTRIYIYIYHSIYIYIYIYISYIHIYAQRTWFSNFPKSCKFWRHRDAPKDTLIIIQFDVIQKSIIHVMNAYPNA